MTTPTILHGTSVVFCGRGVFIRGPSGCGKSDIALRLIDAGGMLVADDRTQVRIERGRVMASPPETIKGMIEIRGIGLMQVPFCAEAPLDIVIQCEEGPIERMPEPIHMVLEGVKLPLYLLHPFEASAVAKIRAILQNLG